MCSSEMDVKCGATFDLFLTPPPLAARLNSSQIKAKVTGKRVAVELPLADESPKEVRKAYNIMKGICQINLRVYILARSCPVKCASSLSSEHTF
jgi:hypothetical protein